MDTETDHVVKRRGRRPKTTHEGHEVNEATEITQQLEAAVQANEEFKAENDFLRNEIADIRAMLAKNTPVVRRRLDDFDEAGIQGIVEENKQGFALPEGDLDRPDVKSKIEYEAFMNEMVDVHISDATENPDHIGFVISVNGMEQAFYQGQEHRVKRYFVEGLARAKKTSFGNRQKDDRFVGDGENAYEYRAMTGVRYPFSVINDTRKGVDWLAAIRRQP